MEGAELRFDFSTFKRLIDHAYDGICIWNRERKLVYINNACYRRYGVSPEEMIGKSVEYFTSGETPFWDASTSPLVFREKRPIIQMYHALAGMDVLMITVPVFDDRGEVEYAIQTSRDGYQNLIENISPVSSFLTPGNEPGKKNVCPFVYKSDQFKELLKLAAQIAATDEPCLILGETGTGKGELASYIHKIGTRKEAPFLYINIASLNPSLIESQLFGYRKGAFSGAKPEGSAGLFQAADGGVLFLDEIGDMPYELQAKILHVIQYGEIIPVGGVKSVKLNVRILSATNCSLHSMMESGRFRQDLYHRLNVFELFIPPLRQRPDDLLLLITHFLNMYNKKYDKLCTLGKETKELLLKYQYPGNVRELSNIIERCVLTSKEPVIDPAVLPKNVFNISDKPNHFAVSHSNFEAAREEFERQFILQALKKNPTSRSLAAELGISQSKANRLIQKYKP